MTITITMMIKMMMRRIIWGLIQAYLVCANAKGRATLAISSHVGAGKINFLTFDNFRLNYRQYFILTRADRDHNPRTLKYHFWLIKVDCPVTFCRLQLLDSHFFWNSAVSFVGPPTKTVYISMTRADPQILIGLKLIVTEYSFNVSSVVNFICSINNIRR